MHIEKNTPNKHRVVYMNSENVSIKKIAEVQELLQKQKNPTSIYGLRKIKMMNAGTVRNALNYLISQGLVETFETNSGKYYNLKKVA